MLDFVLSLWVHMLKSSRANDVGIAIPLQCSLTTLLIHYMPLLFWAFSHFLIIISDLRLVKEEKMFRHLNIFLNYLVNVSNRGARSIKVFTHRELGINKHSSLCSRFARHLVWGLSMVARYSSKRNN